MVLLKKFKKRLTFLLFFLVFCANTKVIKAYLGTKIIQDHEIVNFFKKNNIDIDKIWDEQVSFKYSDLEIEQCKQNPTEDSEIYDNAIEYPELFFQLIRKLSLNISNINVSDILNQKHSASTNTGLPILEFSKFYSLLSQENKPLIFEEIIPENSENISQALIRAILSYYQEDYLKLRFKVGDKYILSRPYMNLSVQKISDNKIKIISFPGIRQDELYPDPEIEIGNYKDPCFTRISRWVLCGLQIFAPFVPTININSSEALEIRKNYELLGLEPGATPKQITKQCQVLKAKYHPDKNLQNIKESTKKFIEIQSICEKLKGL